jgi:hypothetical protein
MMKIDKNVIIIAVSAVALLTGVITYLSIPRDLDRDTSSIYMYGRKNIIVAIVMAMMFGGAVGVVFGVTHMTPYVGTNNS